MPDQHALELIHEEHDDAFNQYVEKSGGEIDLTNAHLRSHDLRKFNLKRANLCGAYLRAADLRALDLSDAWLDGASLKDARVSGTLFPRDLHADEIIMSLTHGTRLRHRT